MSEENKKEKLEASFAEAINKLNELRGGGKSIYFARLN